MSFQEFNDGLVVVAVIPFLPSQRAPEVPSQLPLWLYSSSGIGLQSHTGHPDSKGS